MNPQKVKLFKIQPPLLNKHITDLQKRGLVTPFLNSEGKPHYKRAGWVAGHNVIAKALKDGRVSQTDARRLLAIEVGATDGKPRRTHVSRLMVASYAEDKAAVHANIKSYC
jgi:hypothetical protein